MSVYLDYNSSALVRPQVQAIMAEALAEGGNPNAVHTLGRRALARIETARARVASLVGADPSDVVFSSGGTESNAQAIASGLAAGCQRLIVSATEHPCVAETAARSGADVEILPVDADGVADMNWLADALGRPGRAMVVLHHANNESGVIQPVAQAAALTRAAGGWIHVDAIQSAGKIMVDMAALDADSLSLSAHKLGGPQGVGALILKSGRSAVRILHGSGQERGLRAGTQNTPGIAGFGVAAELAQDELDMAQAHGAWRDAAQARIVAAGAAVVGARAARLPNTLFLGVPDWDSPQQLITLDLAGVMVSAGSACSSGKVRPSTTMVAMGLDDLAGGGVRASGGWATVEGDWVRFADAWTEAYGRYRARQSARAGEYA